MQSTAAPGGASASAAPNWVREACWLIAHTEDCYSKWEGMRVAGHDVIVDESGCRRTLWAWEDQIGWSITMLYRTTGHCAFADVPEGELAAYVPVICARYRAFLAQCGAQPLENRVRAALSENVELLGTDLWWPALNYICRRTPATAMLTTLPRFVRWPVDQETNSYIRETVRAWLEQVSPRLVWSPAQERFVVVNQLVTLDDDEVRVASEAGTLELEEPPDLRLDWERIHKATTKWPSDRGLR